MTDIKDNVVRLNEEFAKLRDVLGNALRILQHEPEFKHLNELTKEMDAKHREFNGAIGPAVAYLEEEHAKVKADLEQTQANIADLEAKAEAAKAAAEQPIPEPPAPPPPLVPGLGDPKYGITLGDELLQLLGIGPAQYNGGDIHHESVWHLESVDWEFQKSHDKDEEAVPPPVVKKRRLDPIPEPDSTEDSFGKSIDMDAH